MTGLQMFLKGRRASRPTTVREALLAYALDWFTWQRRTIGQVDAAFAHVLDMFDQAKIGFTVKEFAYTARPVIDDQVFPGGAKSLLLQQIALEEIHGVIRAAIESDRTNSEYLKIWNSRDPRTDSEHRHMLFDRGGFGEREVDIEDLGTWIAQSQALRGEELRDQGRRIISYAERQGSGTRTRT